jgi:hypothetical protein
MERTMINVITRTSLPFIERCISLVVVAPAYATVAYTQAQAGGEDSKHKTSTLYTTYITRRLLSWGVTALSGTRTTERKTG